MVTNKLIVLTGLDGSGKDFVAKHLTAIDEDATYISTPTPPFLACRSQMDQIALSLPEAHYLFYLASVIHASKIIDKKIKAGNVYCGRYLIDTVAYHRAMGLSVRMIYETSLYTIRKPDLTIYLEISDEKVRQYRLKARKATTTGDSIVNRKEFRNLLLREYERLSNHFIRVDNTNRDIEEVAFEILSLIRTDQNSHVSQPKIK